MICCLQGNLLETQCLGFSQGCSHKHPRPSTYPNARIPEVKPSLIPTGIVSHLSIRMMESLPESHVSGCQPVDNPINRPLPPGTAPSLARLFPLTWVGSVCPETFYRRLPQGSQPCISYFAQLNLVCNFHHGGEDFLVEAP